MSSIISTKEIRKKVNQEYNKCDQAFKNLKNIRTRLEAKNEKLRVKLGVKKGYKINNKEYISSNDPFTALAKSRDRISKIGNNIDIEIKEMV